MSQSTLLLTQKCILDLLPPSITSFFQPKTLSGAIMSGLNSVFNQPKPVVSLDKALTEAINSGVQPYPIPGGRAYGYGTAGVRYGYTTQHTSG